MTSDISRVPHNTRERLTSTDLNDNVRHHHFALQTALSAALGPDRLQSGVVTGFRVSVDATSRTVTVTSGLGLIEDQTKSFPDSTHRWIQSDVAITASIAASTGFARWDVVEIAAGTANSTSVLRDVWDPNVPPNGAFGPSSVTKAVISTPTVSLRAGADNSPNPPNFPGGTTGKLPLAYVYVDDSGNVTGGDAGVVMCRPILRAPGALDVALTPYLPSLDLSIESHAWVQGGGLSVISDSATSVHTQRMHGRFPLHALGFSIGHLMTVTDDPLVWSGGARPTTDQAVYAYVVPPPFPVGYDAVLAPREFHVGTSVATHFKSASIETENCIVVFDVIAPSTSSGAQGGATANGQIADWPFRSGTTMATSQRQKWVYIGSADYDASQPAFMKQSVSGSEVRLDERQPLINFVEHGNGSYSPRSFKWDTSPPVTAQGHFPSHAQIIRGVFTGTVPTGAPPPSHTSLQLTIRDDDASAGTFSDKIFFRLNVDGGTPVVGWPVQLRALGNVTFTISPTPSGLATAQWQSQKYEDPVLALR